MMCCCMETGPVLRRFLSTSAPRLVAAVNPGEAAAVPVLFASGYCGESAAGAPGAAGTGGAGSAPHTPFLAAPVSVRTRNPHRRVL